MPLPFIGAALGGAALYALVRELLSSQGAPETPENVSRAMEAVQLQQQPNDITPLAPVGSDPSQFSVPPTAYVDQLADTAAAGGMNAGNMPPAAAFPDGGMRSDTGPDAVPGVSANTDGVENESGMPFIPLPPQALRDVLTRRGGGQSPTPLDGEVIPPSPRPRPTGFGPNSGRGPIDIDARYDVGDATDDVVKRIVAQSSPTEPKLLTGPTGQRLLEAPMDTSKLNLDPTSEAKPGAAAAHTETMGQQFEGSDQERAVQEQTRATQQNAEVRGSDPLTDWLGDANTQQQAVNEQNLRTSAGDNQQMSGADGDIYDQASRMPPVEGESVEDVIKRGPSFAPGTPPTGRHLVTGKAAGGGNVGFGVVGEDGNIVMDNGRPLMVTEYSKDPPTYLDMQGNVYDGAGHHIGSVKNFPFRGGVKPRNIMPKKVP